MANFPSFTFTAAGRAAITRSLSGKDVDRLIITKCVLGDGVYSGGVDSLKDVTSPKITVTVSEYTDNGDGTSVTRFVYDNASLDVGFSHREMGIYAKNGDSGTELLLCYSNAGDQYSYIRAGTVDSVTKQRKATMPPQTFKFVLATGGSGSVNAVIDPKGYVDVEMLNAHNTDPTAHPDIRQKLNSYASNITALQTSDNAKFKAVSVSNATLTFTKGDNTTTAVTVNNVANATNAGSASKLASKVKLNGNAFDGSQDIFVPQTPYITGIDLRDTKYDRGTWYPCYRGTGNGQPLNDTVYNENWVSLICSTSILAGSLDAKGAGYNNGSVTGQEHRVAILTRGYGVGSTTVGNIILDNSSYYCSDKSYIPIGYMEVSNRIPCFYLLGGYNYLISCSDKAVGWTVVTEETKLSYGNSFSPVKAYPGIQKSRLTVSCNIDGNADTATKATQDGNGNNIANTYLKKSGDTVTGELNVPTQATTDNSTKVANTAFVQSAVANKVSQLVNSAPSTLDTLNELATALGNDPNFATTVATQIGQKADKTELNNHNTDPTAHNNIKNAIPRISIIKGNCSDGQTIPLPDGYTESQCTIFVSMSTENPNGYWFDVAESGAKNMLKVDCYAEGRILRCAMTYAGFDGWRTGNNSGDNVGPRIACIANYMVIGIKYGG